MKATITTADYAVLCATVSLSVLIGLYYAVKERHHTSAYRYHLGAGKLKALPVALSLVVTFESSIFFIGYPAEVYVHGFIFWLFNIGMSLGFTNLIWTSIPLFYPLNITSVYEYLEARFGASDIRRFATCLGSLSSVLYAGIVLYGAGTALESVTDIPAWASITAMTGIAVIYTALGGLKAVVAADVVQGIIMFTAIFAVIVKGTFEVGGVSRVLTLNEPSGRMQLVDFNPDPMVRHTFWTLVVGNTVGNLWPSFNQSTIQRLKSTATKREATKVVLIAIPLFVILQILVMYEGLVAFAYFSNKGCDPLASGAIDNPNQVIAFTVFEMFKTSSGFPGLFLGGLCSASLSTVSSLLSSVSAIVSEDVVKQYWKGVTDSQLTKVSKVIVLITGIVCAAFAILISQTKAPLTQIAVSISGTVGAPITALFLMAIYVKSSSRNGVMAGAIAGLVFGCWLSGGYNFSKGRKVTPWLPLGPTDQCFNGNETGAPLNTTMESTHMYTFKDSFTTPIDVSNVHDTEQIITGLDNLYSISYVYFPTLIFIVTTVVGLIISKCTKPEITGEQVSQHLMLSARKQFICCFKNNETPSEELNTFQLTDM